jgi:hypothetical protein
MSEEIVDIIKIINHNKASGPDIISHKMLKICPEKTSSLFSSKFLDLIYFLRLYCLNFVQNVLQQSFLSYFLYIILFRMY